MSSMEKSSVFFVFFYTVNAFFSLRLSMRTFKLPVISRQSNSVQVMSISIKSSRKCGEYFGGLCVTINRILGENFIFTLNDTYSNYENSPRTFFILPCFCLKHEVWWSGFNEDHVPSISVQPNYKITD